MRFFMLKSLALAGFMFVIVLGGMQTANDGISRMKGYEDSGFEQPVSLGKQNTGEINVAIMGGEVSQNSIEEKKKQLEEIESFNLFSAMGKALSGALSGTAKALIELLAH